MSKPIQKFKSDIKVILRDMKFTFIFLSILSCTFGILGGIKNSFSNLPSFILVVLFPLIGYCILYAVLYILRWMCPITIYQNGIKCYNNMGWYSFVKWQDITRVYFHSIQNLPYLHIE